MGATTDAARAIAIVLMLTGIGAFSILTGAVSQHFVASRPVPRAKELSDDEKAIMARLDELSLRLASIEMARKPSTINAAQDSSIETTV
jgi:hypothetical protein